jgi:hypothetical protein
MPLDDVVERYLEILTGLPCGCIVIAGWDLLPGSSMDQDQPRDRDDKPKVSPYVLPAVGQVVSIDYWLSMQSECKDNQFHLNPYRPVSPPALFRLRSIYIIPVTP